MRCSGCGRQVAKKYRGLLPPPTPRQCEARATCGILEHTVQIPAAAEFFSGRQSTNISSSCHLRRWSNHIMLRSAVAKHIPSLFSARPSGAQPSQPKIRPILWGWSFDPSPDNRVQGGAHHHRFRVALPGDGPEPRSRANGRSVGQHRKGKV